MKSAVATPRIEEVRLGLHAEKTRLVLELDQKVPYQIFLLPDPYRVVIDLPEVDWQPPPGSGVKGAGLVDGYRYGLFDKGVYRIVLDTAEPVKVAKSFTIGTTDKFGPRLVVDLEATTRDKFLELSKATLALKKEKRRETAVEPRGYDPLAQEKPIAKPHGKRIIVVDAGHGGVDPGAIGKSGIYEKNITLKTALELKQALEATGRYKVVLTRDRDIFLRLRQRINTARTAGAELFISLHADSNPSPSVRGASVYTLSETASDREAARLARQENKADLIAGVDLTQEPAEVTNILLDLAQRETMNFSAKYARFLIDKLSRESQLLRNTHRFAGFVVLKAPDIPSVLVELGYLSNREDERLLQNKNHRAGLVRSIVRATNAFFDWQDSLQRS